MLWPLPSPRRCRAIFERATFGLDVATGKVPVGDGYSTQGPQSSWGLVQSLIPPAVENTCYVYTANDSCTPDQKLALLNGSAMVEDFVVVEPKGWKLTGLTVVNRTGTARNRN